MNSDVMRWLLDLDVIPRDADETLHVVWEHPWPTWVWFLIVALAGGYAFWSYRRLEGTRRGRGLLALTRAALIALVLVVLSGPMLELPRESIEEDWVLVMADRSRSMQIEDVQTATGRISREQQLAQLLDDAAPMLNKLAGNKHVVYLGFHFGSFDLTAPEDASDSLPVDLGSPSGERTRLNTALEQALQRVAARPMSGVVLLSDGRTDDPPSRALVRRLQADSIPVFTVPLGSADAMGDLAINRVDVPRRAFVRDKVPVVVDVDRLGSAVAGLEGSVSLVDTLTGEVLDRVELDPWRTRDAITLVAEPEMAGDAIWEVVIETTQPDLIPDNNIKLINIELVDRPLRVLMIDGYPRWEYRYVKNLLVREKSIESSVFLISAARDFAQEGNQPITRLPRSPEEFADYDVIIIGDVPSTFFSPEQLDMMREHVAENGAGLLWIAGERALPSTYSGTALEDLLPMRGTLLLPPIGEPVNMQPTDLAERLGVLRLATGDEVGWPLDLLDPSYGWSSLYYAQRIEAEQLKPTAEVLAETVQTHDGAALPLVLKMRYGAGQSIYVATDEIWRWRYGRGELYPEQFWVQLIRMLGRESLTSSGQAAVFEVSPRRLEVGQPVRVDLRLLDAALSDQRRVSVTAVVEDELGQPIAELELRREDDAADRYSSIYIPDRPGSFRMRLDDSELGNLALIAPFEVIAPDDELRIPESDHETLEVLSNVTGGRLLAPEELSDLPQYLPNRSLRTIYPLTERIWDTPMIFALLLLLLTFEWIGRKVLRLM